MQMKTMRYHCVSIRRAETQNPSDSKSYQVAGPNSRTAQLIRGWWLLGEETGVDALKDSLAVSYKTYFYF